MTEHTAAKYQSCLVNVCNCIISSAVLFIFDALICISHVNSRIAFHKLSFCHHECQKINILNPHWEYATGFICKIDKN